MVLCCVPLCGSNSWQNSDPAVTFHIFPESGDLREKWIQQINLAAASQDCSDPWSPTQAKSYICSQHFLQTDFREDCDVDTLKPDAVPAVFGHKYIGLGSSTSSNTPKPSPMIVKINASKVRLLTPPPKTSPPIKPSPPLRLGKRPTAKTLNAENNLIEIGPNTFLKINPDVIKVNRKETLSGNTVLQFVMDQKAAKKQPDYLPKLIKTLSKASKEFSHQVEIDENREPGEKSPEKEKESVVLGHIVDTETCKKLTNTQKTKNDLKTPEKSTANIPTSDTENVSTPDAIVQAPVLLSTDQPLQQCLTTGKEKSRQVASLKNKVLALSKKVEELEDKCIVQERQLSYSFLKKLRTIRKNSKKGDPQATYILEQIRCYSTPGKMRWSETTLTQCAAWCRKAPYAYEYFKKADFFKLPCLGTVKRFMKKHPNVKFTNAAQVGDDGESSSDFDFDDSEEDEKADNDGPQPLEGDEADDVQIEATPIDSTTTVEDVNLPSKVAEEQHQQLSEHEQLSAQEQLSVEQLSVQDQLAVQEQLSVQELVLPSGEVVQCLGTGQYIIIPENEAAEYGLSLDQQQDQLIFITDTADQQESSTTG